MNVIATFVAESCFPVEFRILHFRIDNNQNAFGRLMTERSAVPVPLMAVSDRFNHNYTLPLERIKEWWDNPDSELTDGSHLGLENTQVSDFVHAIFILIHNHHDSGRLFKCTGQCMPSISYQIPPNLENT